MKSCNIILLTVYCNKAVPDSRTYELHISDTLLIDFGNCFFGCSQLKLIHGPLILLAGASTWQNLTAWLERGRKPMHYTPVLDLLLRMPYRNSRLWMRVIRFVYVSGYQSFLHRLNEMLDIHTVKCKCCHPLCCNLILRSSADVSGVALPIWFPPGPLLLVYLVWNFQSFCYWLLI